MEIESKIAMKSGTVVEARLMGGIVASVSFADWQACGHHVLSVS